MPSSRMPATNHGGRAKDVGRERQTGRPSDDGMWPGPDPSTHDKAIFERALNHHKEMPKVFRQGLVLGSMSYKS